MIQLSRPCPHFFFFNPSWVFFLLHSGKEHLNISSKELERGPSREKPGLYSDAGWNCLTKSAPIFLTCNTKPQQLSEQKANPVPSQKCGTESDTVAIKSTGDLRFFSITATKKSALFDAFRFDVTVSDRRVKCFGLLFLCFSFSFLKFRLVGVVNTDEYWSQPSFQEENNRLVCAVAMAFIVLQNFAIVYLFALIITPLLHLQPSLKDYFRYFF